MLSYKRKRYTLLIFLLLMVMGICVVFPVYLAIINSIKPLEENFLFPFGVYPRLPTAENYTGLFRGDFNPPFARLLANSAIITAVITVLRIWIICPAAYVLAKINFTGRKLINRAVEMALLFTGSAAIAVQYNTLEYFGISLKYYTELLPLIPNVLLLILMRQFIRGIPDCIEEAARIDGAGDFCVYRRIILPNVKPAWITLIVLSISDGWNASGTRLVYNKPSVTVADALTEIEGVGGAAAVSVILMAVPIVFFLFYREEIMETLKKARLK